MDILPNIDQINLGGESADFLREFSARIEAIGYEKASQEIFGSGDYEEQTCLLQFYANKKIRAMEERAVGHILRALEFEGECDEIYSQLPKAYRW